MPIKKSDLYSALWASCDALRGGMEPSEYKDYVLFMLFIKYISDKYAGKADAPLFIPNGASFEDMKALKGKPNIGDRINTHIIQPLIDTNSSLTHSDFPDFNDPKKLGEGKERQDKLTQLIAIFENPDLDFAGNRAEHDDILGDAYEYLMRHFAQDSGKSKGQFYTPAEVSRTIAQLIEIGPDNTNRRTTAYDPTCGSGSLLLKVAAAAGKPITLYGQEISATTAGLARMNMILHDFPEAKVFSGNTLADPKIFDKDGQLRTFDYVVANPPFSDKAWSAGLTPDNDPHQRFAWGVPPARQGDYAYLLHIIRSLKARGKGACILPHGVLFRGNAEAVIRRQLVESGYLTGIVGLPANLFYGTGIPACILVLDKDNAGARRGIFMIDASKGFLKDGNKNRLRERDIHRIVDAFRRKQDVPGYARMVGFDEIRSAKNDYNLNLPRYIDTSEAEDLQDIEGHLRGGIPQRDVDALGGYWDTMPALRRTLFAEAGRAGYLRLTLPPSEVKSTVLAHDDFEAFRATVKRLHARWVKATRPELVGFGRRGHPKQLIHAVSESLLAAYAKAPLLDAYAVYQHLMDYWAQTMQDDAYLLAADGWQARPARIVEKNRKGQLKDKGWTCDLVPKPLIVARYFAAQQRAVDKAALALEAAGSALEALEEEHGGDDGLFASLDKLNAAEVKRRIEAIGRSQDDDEELAALQAWQSLSEQEAEAKKRHKALVAALDARAFAKYAELSVEDVQTLVVDDKWLAALSAAVEGEVDRVSQALTRRVKELAERYDTPLPQLAAQAAELEAKVAGHLQKMGFAWT